MCIIINFDFCLHYYKSILHNRFFLPLTEVAFNFGKSFVVVEVNLSESKLLPVHRYICNKVYQLSNNWMDIMGVSLYLKNKNIFNKNERRCSDVKTQKACEQGWEANIGPKIKQTTSI